MRRVGMVVRAVGGMAVAQLANEAVPDIGDTVLDERLDAVGQVVDVMGPVDRPYVVIAPENRRPPTLLNDPLYVR